MIRILIVDDQNLIRQGLCALLEPRPKIKVVGTAEDGKSAMEQVKALRPDIVLTDIEMPGINGITITQEVCQKFPETKVIVLSSYENQTYVVQALQAGAQGYLLKNTLAENLEQAILLVHQGQSQIESKLLKKAIAEFSSSDFTASSDRNGFTSPKEQPIKLKVNADSKEKFISTTSVKVPDFNNTHLPNSLNESLSKITETSLKQVFKPTKIGAKEIQIDRSRQKSAISLTNTKSWINSKLAIFSTLLIMTIISIFFFNYSSSTSTSTSSLAKPKKTNVLPVKTMKIKSVQSYQTSQTYTGEVTALRTSEVGFERGGKLIEVFVEEGDRISLGTPLAKLDTANLQAQRQSLIAQKEQQEAVLAELKNGARTERINAAQANVGDLQQQLELEKLKSSRREYLYGEGAVSREQLDEVAFNRKALSERLANAQSNLNELQNGNRVEQISAQQAAVDRLTAEIEDLDITINKSILKSPFDGIVSARNLDEGTVVEAGTSILRLVENDQLKVKIGVPINVASRMQSGSKEQVTIGGKNYSALLSSILPEVNTTTSTRTLVLKLASTAATQVSPQQIARLNVTQTNNTDGYWLPITALVKGDRGLWSCYALVESSDGNNSRAERRYIELLETQENRVLVRGTLQSGDEIVTDGTHRLVPGQLVRKS